MAHDENLAFNPNQYNITRIGISITASSLMIALCIPDLIPIKISHYIKKLCNHTILIKIPKERFNNVWGF